MRRYHRKEWQAFRQSIIERDGGACTRCERGKSDGAVLQVHHKSYLPGRLPWDYPSTFCETLCQGCHAEEHGIVRPFTDWELGGYDDLGDLTGECELCGTPIRHVFFVHHAKWPSLEVGEICCDHLTTSKAASDHMDGLRASKAKRQRFIRSKRWEVQKDRSLAIFQNGISIAIKFDGAGHLICVDGIRGKRRFSSAEDAKHLVFEVMETGQLQAFLKKHASSSVR